MIDGLQSVEHRYNVSTVLGSEGVGGGSGAGRKRGCGKEKVRAGAVVLRILCGGARPHHRRCGPTVFATGARLLAWERAVGTLRLRSLLRWAPSPHGPRRGPLREEATFRGGPRRLRRRLAARGAGVGALGAGGRAP